LIFYNIFARSLYIEADGEKGWKGGPVYIRGRRGQVGRRNCRCRKAARAKVPIPRAICPVGGEQPNEDAAGHSARRHLF